MYSNVETGLFTPMQHAAITALQTPRDWLSDRNQIYAKRQVLLVQLLEALNCQPFSARASLYVWAKVPDSIKNVEEYCFELLEKTGVFLTPGTVFGQAGEGYVRVAICQPESVLQTALERLQTKGVPTETL
jgi:LL-diaminopimelate aminotransferase